MRINVTKVDGKVILNFIGDDPMQEKACDRRMACATVDIEVCKKVEKKFRLSKSDSLSVIYSRALEESVRDVVLSEEDYRQIADEIARNRNARETKRNK